MTNKTITDKFFEIFSNPALKGIMTGLDKDTYENVKLTYENNAEIKDTEALKENNVLFTYNYTHSGKEYPLYVLASEELIAKASDLMMGGTGVEAYKGSLSELEINASLKLLKNISDNITTTHNELCEKQIQFKNKPKVTTKADNDYVQEFNDIKCNLITTYNIYVEQDKNYKIHVLLDYNDTKDTISKLSHLFKEDEPEKAPILLDTMDLGILSDIEVDLQAQLGTSQIPLKYAIELTSGSIIELDNSNENNVKIFANDVEVAIAEIVAIDDTLGLKIKQITKKNENE